MKLVLRIIGGLLAFVLVVALCTYAWAARKTSTLLERTIAVHAVDFPIPFPIPDSEIARLKLTKDSADHLALARAIERGHHLVESRYTCGECHGKNFGGGVMVDAFPIGRLLGPNLTTGRGSRTTNFKPIDWDHIVRHGVLSTGKPAAMPSQDFAALSDQELSDIVAYIRSQPPVDSEVPRISLGPLGKVLVATGKIPLAADLIANHNGAHVVFPPATEASAQFGKHLAAVCSGCHRPDFAGGPIPGGDPSWPPSQNLTSHADALGKWTFDDFRTTLRTGKRPDGTTLKLPMSAVVPYANKMSDVEVEALWKYLQSLPPVAPTTK